MVSVASGERSLGKWVAAIGAGWGAGLWIDDGLVPQGKQSYTDMMWRHVLRILSSSPRGFGERGSPGSVNADSLCSRVR